MFEAKSHKLQVNVRLKRVVVFQYNIYPVLIEYSA
jgi:hypothetical protein